MTSGKLFGSRIRRNTSAHAVVQSEPSAGNSASGCRAEAPRRPIRLVNGPDSSYRGSDRRWQRPPHRGGLQMECRHSAVRREASNTEYLRLRSSDESS